ncbi:MAG: hypothetical protein ACREFO_08130 [Acetobacteraceae bacterium]
MGARRKGFLAALTMLAAALTACTANPEAANGAQARVLPAAGAASGGTVVSEIHNAPGWQPSHRYLPATGPATRVVNGLGWSPSSGSYHPGLKLDAYQLVSAAPCLSAPGRGPQGRGAAIQDGTCVWKHLSDVDYISITGWAFDSRPWQSGTIYHYLDQVTSGSPLRAYALDNESCTSGAAPTGTGGAKSAIIAPGDGCHWQYLADILYTSRRSYIPTESFTSKSSAATLRLKANHEALLWNDREYVAGENGETAPIRLQMHDDYRHEGGVILGCTNTPCPHLIVTTAPGESFRDRLTPADPLRGYDPKTGVAIRDSTPYRWPYEPAGLDLHDNFVDLIGLQIKSVHGAAVNGMSSFANSMTVRDCILDGGSYDQWTAHAAVTTDTSSVIVNSLIITHAPIGVVLKYPGFVLHSTIVAPDRKAGTVGIETFATWVFPDTTVSNTAIFGFAHAAAHEEAHTSWSAQSSHNITDAPVGDSGTAISAYGASMPATVDRLPGTLYGAAMGSAFVRPGSDWRLARNSPLRGAGSAFGAFALGCDVNHPDCPQRRIYDFDSPDIIGTVRPQARRYDIGAWQSAAAGMGP